MGIEVDATTRRIPEGEGGMGRRRFWAAGFYVSWARAMRGNFIKCGHINGIVCGDCEQVISTVVDTR